MEIMSVILNKTLMMKNNYDGLLILGDWEHFSLFFKGTTYPDEMYVSAHDSGGKMINFSWHHYDID